MIEIIESDCYLETLKPMSNTSGGISAKTYLATVQWPNGEIMDSYVKLFPEDVRTKEIINESFGFLLAKTVNLRQSQRAALIKLDVNDFEIDTSNDPFALANGYVYGWVTSSLGGDNLKKIYLKNPPTITHVEAQKLMSFLSNWPNFSQLIAFDDWIGNIDRNIGNLILINKNDIAIIDHGRLFGVINWLVEDIDAKLSCPNVMLSIFKMSHSGAIIHPARYQPILDSAVQQQISYVKDFAEIKQKIINIDSIMGSHVNTKIDTFFDYFNNRFANIASRLPHALAA
ncbi:hypothetical protein [Acinetobacter geminorum]